MLDIDVYPVEQKKRNKTTLLKYNDSEIKSTLKMKYTCDILLNL